MAAGFRPGTDLPLNVPGSKISSDFGLNPNEPKVVLNPSLTRPEVAAAIDANWEQIKRPGIVTFVIDTSSSMDGAKMQQAKDGLVRALDNMAKNNKVGLVTFDHAVNTTVPVAPLAENRFVIAEAVKGVRPNGQTALYDAIRAGIEMTDRAPGEPDAIRAVVVLTDGQANMGQTYLSDLIQIMSRHNELPIPVYRAFVGDTQAKDEGGGLVSKKDMIGSSLAIKTDHPVQIFFIGIGEDADLDVGSMLAQATGAEFQGVAEEDLAAVLEEIGRYF